MSDVSLKMKAELSYSQGLWYAWGRIDSGQYVGLGLDAFEFAESVKAKTIEFETEKTIYNESIQGQWANYVASKTEPVV